MNEHSENDIALIYKEDDHHKLFHELISFVTMEVSFEFKKKKKNLLHDPIFFFNIPFKQATFVHQSNIEPYDY